MNVFWEPSGVKFVLLSEKSLRIRKHKLLLIPQAGELVEVMRGAHESSYMKSR